MGALREVRHKDVCNGFLINQDVIECVCVCMVISGKYPPIYHCKGVVQWEPCGGADVSGALGATFGRYQIIINIDSSLLCALVAMWVVITGASA